MKKGFIVFMALAMILSYSVALTGNAKAATDGDLIKMAGYPAVYYLNGGKRYVFPNEKTFKTWYADFSGVITVSQSEMESYPLGGNVTYRPGTRLVKVQTVPTVYAVEPGGVLRSIVSEANAKALYGDDWNKRIDDVPDAFWVNYTVGSDLTPGKYPTGTLVKEEGSSTTYYIDGNTKRPIATGAAFDANNFNWAYLVVASDLSGYTDGPSITGPEADLMTVAGSSTTSTTAAGSVNVALSASTAPAATIISDTAEGAQALIPFVTVDFTAPASGDVTVTNLKFKRTGISADADINATYIYDGNTFLAEGGSISSGYVTFNDANGLFTVPAGTTKSVTFKADLVENTSAGKTMAFQLEEVTTKNNATVNGSLPLAGNTMTTASVADLGYVTYTGGNTPTSAQSVNPGETDFEMYKIGLTANDQDLKLAYVKFTLLGSIDTDDIENIKLKVDGTEIASGTVNSDRELVFDLTDSPYLIEKGQSKTFSLRGDIMKGSTRTFRWSIENSRDLVLMDANYNVYVTPYGSGSTSWTAKKSSSSSYVYTVNSGTLAVTLDSTSPTDNVPAGATNVKLATYKFEATGEDIKVKTLNVSSSGTTAPGTLNNVKILADGVQVGSTKDITYTGNGTQFNLGSSLIIPAGESVLVDIYGDIKDANGNNYGDGDTISIVLDAGSGDNAVGQESLTSLDVPSSDLDANDLSVTAASISIVAYSGYGDQNVVKPATQAKVGSFVISAGAYEGMTIDTINVDNATSGVMQNMKLIDHDSGVQYGNTKVTLTSTSATDNVFSINNLDLAAGESRVIDVYADIKSNTGANTIQVQVGAIGSSDITGTTKYHNSSSDGDADVSLQTMTITTGSIAASTDASQPDADIIIAGTTVPMNAVKFTASNEAYKVTKLTIKDVTSGTYDSVGKVIIEYPNEAGSTVTASAYLNSSGYAYFYNLDFYIPKDDTAILTVKAEVPTISSGADSGDKPRLDFDYNTSFSATGQSSNSVSNSVGSSDIAGNSMVVRKTRPTVSEASLSTTVLSNGEKTIAKFTIAADSAADVYFKELNFTVATSSGIGLTNIKLYEDGNSTALNATGVNTDGGNIQIVTDDEETVAAGTSKSYSLKGTVSGASGTTDSLYVTMDDSASSSYAGTSTTYNLLKLYETGGLLWSDGSETPHSSTSADYADCNYVKNLPITFDTLSD